MEGIPEMSMNSQQMGAIMGALGKMDFNKLSKVGQIEAMDIKWTQIDNDDNSIVKVNINVQPKNEEFGEVFLEMLKLVAGDKVTITKQ